MGPSSKRRWRVASNSSFITWGFAVLLVPLVAVSCLTVAVLFRQLLLTRPHTGALRFPILLAVGLPVLALLLRGTVRQLLPQRVCLGRDGLEISSWLARPLRIAHANIAQIELDEHALRIVERGGREATIYARERASLHDLALALDARRREATVPPPFIGALARTDEPLPRWRARVSRLLRASETYRDPALDEAALWQVAEHPAAQVEQRVGAVLALHGRSDESAWRADVASRMRADIDAGVLPALREALALACEGRLDADLLAGAEAEFDPGPGGASVGQIRKA